MAAIMLVLGGDVALSGLQNITVVTSLPFAVVMLLITFALWRDLRRDALTVRRDIAIELVREAIELGIEEHGEEFSLATEPVTREAEMVVEKPQTASDEESGGESDRE